MSPRSLFFWDRFDNMREKESFGRRRRENEIIERKRWRREYRQSKN